MMQLIEEFRQAAANAIAAGFDGVEIHGANRVNAGLYFLMCLREKTSSQSLDFLFHLISQTTP